jgi:CRP-like cAMP-binding protein
MSNKSVPLASCYLFDGLTEEQKQRAIEMLAPLPKRFTSGDCILSAEENQHCLCFIESGRVLVSTSGTNGAVLLTEHKAGACVGAASLFSREQAYPTVVRAASKVAALIIQEKTLENLLSIDPNIALNHIRFLTDKIRFLNDKIDSLSGRDGESKVAKYILLHADNEGLFSPPASMTKIAASLDISRASLYRILDQMERNNLLENTNGIIHIIDTTTLERIANLK